MKSRVSHALLLLFLLLPKRALTDNNPIIPDLTQNDFESDDDVSADTYFDEKDDYDLNSTESKGVYLGSRCEFTCNPSLLHVWCNVATGRCECEKKWPVKLGPTRGCAKPKKLGEQCYYTDTCAFSDQHASCIQVDHNAICQCKGGYHMVTLSRPKKVFCSEDLVILTTSLQTLAGVFAGIAVLAGLICFTLRLFSSARYTQPREFDNVNVAPPILFSHEKDISLSGKTHTNRSVSRSSQRSAGTYISNYSTRRTSNGRTLSGDMMTYGGARGGVMSTSSRAGAAKRAAAILLNMTGSSGEPGRATVLQETDERSSLASVEPPLATYDDDDDDGDEFGDDEPSFSPQYLLVDGLVLDKTHACSSTDTLGSRTGSRRNSLTSVHSAGSLSFGHRMLEREREMKEQREEMRSRLARMSSLPDSLPRVTAAVTFPTPSPLSTDELLPAVSELHEFPSTSRDASKGIVGPCSSKEIL